MKSPSRCVAGIILLSMALSVLGDEIRLAQNGTSQMAIRIPQTATTNLQAAATILADTLGQMTGGVFPIVTFNPATGAAPGLILGTGADLGLTALVPQPGSNMAVRERYILAAANTGAYVVVVGATDLAVTDAIYDFLEQLGCRWFFASPNWTVIPTNIDLAWTTPAPIRTTEAALGTNTLQLNLYADETPDYKMRFIWAEYCGSSGVTGDWRQQELDWNAWCGRNRAVNSYMINAGHAYDAVISWAKSKGRWTDDYYALIGGVRTTTGQLCLGTPAVQQLLRDYAVEKLTGTVESISLEPRDGGNWCECSLCEKIQPLSSGFVTDRIIDANNFAAAAIPAGKFIGMYAYNQHAAAPSLAVSNNIYVLVATAFLSYGNTVEGLLAAWGAKAPKLGIRDYFSVWDWDHNLPGAAKVANLSDLHSRLPSYFAGHADVYSAESTHAWGPLGLGFYIAAKLLWDTDADVEALKADFLTRCFGPAADTMRAFYDRLDPANGYPLGSDLMGQLYALVNTARGQTSDPAIVARLDDLTLYLRYIDLWRLYGSSEIVLRYAWKIRNSNMMDSLSCWRNFSGTWPDGKNWSVKYPDHPWKEAGTFSHAEIVQMNLDGIASNALLPVGPRAFGTDLVYSGGASGTRGTLYRVRGNVYCYMTADASGHLPVLSLADGFSYTNRGPASWDLYTGDGHTLLESGLIPADKVVRPVMFTTTGAGLYLFVYRDGDATSTITWPTGSKVSLCAGSGRALTQAGRATRFYFYVSRGTAYVIANASYLLDCKFYTASGVLKKDYTNSQNYYMDIVIPVGAGEDAQIWYATSIMGVDLHFRNIPPYLALRQDELLIPRDAFADLVPSGQAPDTRGSTFGGFRSVNHFLSHTGSGGALPPLTVNDGAVDTTRGSLDWTLSGEEGSTVLQSGAVPPDRMDHAVSFTNPPSSGAWQVRMDDHDAGYDVTWPTGACVSVAADPNRPFTNRQRSGRLYFSVPPGTPHIDFAADSCADCVFHNGAGQAVFSYAGGTNGYVAVPSGQDGQIWYVTGLSVTGFRFLNIPGVLALNKDELLAPRWVLTEPFAPPPPPAAPAELAITAVSPGSVTLVWTDLSTNETGFKVERRFRDGGSFIQVGALAANTTSWQDTDITAGASYSYRVRAYNAGGNSAYSAAASMPLIRPATLFLIGRSAAPQPFQAQNFSSFLGALSTGATGMTGTSLSASAPGSGSTLGGASTFGGGGATGAGLATGFTAWMSSRSWSAALRRSARSGLEANSSSACAGFSTRLAR